VATYYEQLFIDANGVGPGGGDYLTHAFLPTLYINHRPDGSTTLVWAPYSDQYLGPTYDNHGLFIGTPLEDYIDDDSSERRPALNDIHFLYHQFIEAISPAADKFIRLANGRRDK